jgi:ubiquitin thioesterase OTU1
VIPSKITEKITEYTMDGYAVKRKIESDNSCLFNAVAYTLEGSQSRIKTKAPGLRQVIADIVKFESEFYSEVVLGQPNSEYCHWILKSDSWGGAIELSNTFN